MNELFIAFVTLIVLHDVDGAEVDVNPEQVVALQATKDKNLGTSKRLMAGNVKCVIGLTNGKLLSVIEDCGLVRQAINEAQKAMNR